jgi:hypothetical protein
MTAHGAEVEPAVDWGGAGSCKEAASLNADYHSQVVHARGHCNRFVLSQASCLQASGSSLHAALSAPSRRALRSGVPGGAEPLCRRPVLMLLWIHL